MKFPEYKQVVTLIPGGCPQFLDFGIDMEPLRRERRSFKEELRDPGSKGRYTHYLRCLTEDDSEERRGALVDMTRARGTRGRDDEPGPDYEEEYSVTLEESLNCFRGEWLPMPFLRTSGQTWPDGAQCVERGPSNWARGMFIPTRERPGVWHLAIVFDTRVENKPHDDMGRYFALSREDLSSAAEFMLAWHVRDNSWFVNEEWVDQWLKDRYDAWARRSRRRYGQEQFVQKHLAYYMTWLDAARRAMGKVRVKVFHADIREPLPGEPAQDNTRDRGSDANRSGAIDVDLVLDIGNSRTTGILVETTSERPTSLNDSYLLELRDLTDLNSVTAEPFETRVEFFDVSFGNDMLSRRSGRATPAFAWPSCVRVGPEATRLATYAVCAEGNTGMSSPKRYLWDETSWTQSWRFNMLGGNEPMVTRGLLPRQLNECGTPLFLYKEGKGRRDMSEAMRRQPQEMLFASHFTRSSLMMFMVAEIITQALVNINSPANRNNRMLSDKPRHLRRIIFTVPTAMPVAERRIFTRWVELAVKVVWHGLDWDTEETARNFRYQSEPKVVCEWDEASCSHLVLLYNEIMVKHVGNAGQYFRLFGRPRKADDGSIRPSVRVASIDIGGGTTDLSITTHVLASEASETPRIVPRMEFRDGFNIAGDEVVRDIILSHVIPAIENELKKRGLDPRNVTQGLFGRYTQAKTQQMRTSQGQFVHLVAVPVALGILQACEAFDRDDERVYTCRFGDFFTRPAPPQTPRPAQAPRETQEPAAAQADSPAGAKDDVRYEVQGRLATMPQDKVLKYFTDVVAGNCGAEGLGVLSISISFSLASVNQAIRRTLGDKLACLCEMVRAYDADILLVTGRPSAWKGVIETILAKPPVTPERIIPMRSYHVGSWYPCADIGGRIADPKSTVVVGAILCALSCGHLQGINFDASRMRPTSTARYVGELDTIGQLKREKVWFTVGADGSVTPPERVITYNSPITIGYRQLAVERWPASRFYQLDFPDKTNLAAGQYRVTVRLDNESDAPVMDVEEVNGRQTEGEIRVLDAEDTHGGRPRVMPVATLQTLPTIDGYWLDSGIVKN